MMYNIKGLRRTQSAFMMVCVAAISLTACGVQRGDDNDKANIADLEARGFESPTLSNQGADNGYVMYSATAGSCRLTIIKDRAIWTVVRVQDKDVAELRDVDVAMLKAKASELDIEYCFTDTTP